MEDYSHEQIHYQTDTGMLLEIVEVSGHSVSKHLSLIHISEPTRP